MLRPPLQSAKHPRGFFSFDRGFLLRSARTVARVGRQEGRERPRVISSCDPVLKKRVQGGKKKKKKKRQKKKNKK
jgi:hypothetical protein